MIKVIELEGTAMYPKIFEDNRDMKGYEGDAVECNGVYTIDVVLDDAEFNKLNESGSKLTGREVEDGQMVKFKRKHEVLNTKTGDVIEMFSGAPRVVDDNEELWVHSEDAPNLVGNGSRVKVAVSVTPDKKRKGIVYTRLEGVKVLELVVYDPEENQMKLPF